MAKVPVVQVRHGLSLRLRRETWKRPDQVLPSIENQTGCAVQAQGVAFIVAQHRFGHGRNPQTPVSRPSRPKDPRSDPWIGPLKNETKNYIVRIARSAAVRGLEAEPTTTKPAKNDLATRLDTMTTAFRDDERIRLCCFVASPAWARGISAGARRGRLASSCGGWRRRLKRPWEPWNA